MSTRNFFEIRTFIPGFTFIIFFILFNIELIFYLPNMKIEIIDLLITFVTLPAIGFIVSQPWFSFYRRIILPYRNPWKPRIDALAKKTGLKLDKICFMQKIIVFDYFGHHFFPKTENNARTDSYLDRRWDLLNTLGSSFSAIIVNLLFNIVLRFLIIPDYYIKSNFYMICNNSAYFVFVLTICILYSLILIEGMMWLKDEINGMCVSLIHSSTFTYLDFHDAFPDMLPLNKEK